MQITILFLVFSSLGSNARLSYSFNNDNQYFGIDSKTGIVFVKKNLLELSNKTVSLLTNVNDHGAHSYSGSTKVEVI